MSNRDFHNVSQYAALGAAMAFDAQREAAVPTPQISGLEALGRYVGHANALPSPEEGAADAVLAKYTMPQQAA